MWQQPDPFWYAPCSNTEHIKLINAKQAKTTYAYENTKDELLNVENECEKTVIKHNYILSL
jgi:hypothetical protein